MVTAYSLTPILRIRLKKPIGTLIRGSFVDTMNQLKDLITEEKPAAIISVGDTVSKNLIEHHMIPQLAIVDGRVMRRKIQPITFAAEKTIHVKNPQGTITEEAIEAIRDSLRGNCHIKIVVDGEEDLLTLIAVLHATENSLVVYGQPYEGVVAVKVTSEKKTEVAEILKIMEHSRKAK